MFIGVNRTWRNVIVGTIGAIPLGMVSLHVTPAQAADTVVVRFGPLEDSFSVSDLRYIAEKGKVPENLSGYARRLQSAQRTQLLAALRTRIPLGVLGISNLLNNQIGTTILNDLASATPREDKAGVQALRAALVLGAASPQGLSIISVIEAYPSQRLVIDLPQAFKVVGNLNTSFWQTQRFMAAIAPRLAAQRPNIKLPLDPTKPGSAQTQVLKLNFSDKQRQRNIFVDVYYSSATTADKPVVVFSHGLASIRTDMRYLAEHLASYGYPVVALEHPGSNETNLNLATQGKVPVLRGKEVLERPKDISFVLDELEKLNQTGDHPLKGKLATNNAMVIGYSYGGSTALLLAGAELQLEKLKERCKDNVVAFSLGEGFQCVSQFLPENRASARDVRIKRAIALNPTTSLLFGDDGLAKISAPTLVFAASADKTTPALIEQIAPFEKIPSPKWLAGIVGATHLSVKDPSTTLDQATAPSTLYSGDEVVGEKAVDVRNYVKAISLAMAAQLTSDADKYAIFLTPEYALYASTQAFPIRLVKEIPPEAQAVVKEFLQGKAP
jgi:predicted dienelactone hydrolase